MRYSILLDHHANGRTVRNRDGIIASGVMKWDDPVSQRLQVMRPLRCGHGRVTLDPQSVAGDAPRAFRGDHEGVRCGRSVDVYLDHDRAGGCAALASSAARARARPSAR